MAQSGPGRHYRRGVSLVEIMRRFPSDKAAHDWFASVRWPDGPHCPRCESDNVQVGTKHKTMPYRCRPCRRYFSVKTGTVMEDSKLGCQTWAVAIYLLTTGLKGQSSMKLHRDLGITQKTAWHLAHRIRQTFATEPESFDGPVEADETYFGGKKKNRPLSERRLEGRGVAGKVAVGGILDRPTNQITATVLPDTKVRTIQDFVRSGVQPGATIFTDEATAYQGMPEFGHESVRHSVFEYVRGQAHTNGLESFWSMLKRGYVGTYHHMSSKHLGRYVSEFAGRHNLREADTTDQMEAMASGFLGKRLRYAQLTAGGTLGLE